jgi:hypothetical protein
MSQSYNAKEVEKKANKEKRAGEGVGRERKTDHIVRSKILLKAEYYKGVTILPYSWSQELPELQKDQVILTSPETLFVPMKNVI